MDIVTVSGIVLGLVAVFSQIGLPTKYKPLVSVVLAIGITILMKGVSSSEIINGILAGLTASGLWSGVKAMGTGNTDEMSFFEMER